MTMKARLLLAAAALAALATAGPRAARAALTVDRVPDLDPCVEAASYPDEDQSPEAAHARRRCRLEEAERKKMLDRQWADWNEWPKREKAMQTWIEQQGLPARVQRPNAADGFLGTGVAHYGLAVAGVFWPNLEGELWGGWGSSAHVNGSGDLHDDRRCLGLRAKWLPIERGNVTPFLAAGAAGCLASLSLFSFNSTAHGDTFGADGVGHFATGSAGLTVTTSVGVRFSLEYIFMWAYYVQASQGTGQRMHDPVLRDAFRDTLAANRHGVRFQVGYAF
jgi:hypothetical protein